MDKRHLIWGIAGGLLIFIAAAGFGVKEFSEEPEFGIFVAMAAVLGGGVLALGTVLLSVFVGIVAARRQKNRDSKKKQGQNRRQALLEWIETEESHFTSSGRQQRLSF